MSSTKSIILGTAGHVDHGKTAFVKALTGTDCDRLQEEKERGITIVLGYARMMLPSGIKVGIVDVPGHERFVSKMVAGASGIDVVAFLVAADEGIKPQTIEHLHICHILGITRGIVVLNKKDLVDEELLILQTEEIEALLKGTGLAGAPIIPVSSVTGEGIADFTRALDRIAREATAKPIDKPFRLPVDATLTITGFGTVVRGTALAGRIAVGEEVILLPEGRKTRLRGIENHGTAVREGWAGERLALNLPDIARDDVDRGVVIAREGYYRPSDTFLAHFRYLAYNKKPIVGTLHCQFHVLTSRVKAQLHLIKTDRLLPGEEGFVVIKASRPLILSAGDAFVIRGYGLFTTIGGGGILHPALPAGRDFSLTDAYLQTLRQGSLADKVALFVLEWGQKGMTVRQLSGLLNVAEDDIQRVADSLKKAKLLYRGDAGRLYHRDPIVALKKNVSAMVRQYHQLNPMRGGINREELCERTDADADFFHLVLLLMLQEGLLLNDRDLVRDRWFHGEGAFADPVVEIVERQFLGYGLQPVVPAETAKALQLDLKVLSEVLNALVRSVRLIRITEGFYIHVRNWEAFQESIARYFKEKNILTPQDLRERFGLSRKFGIPLLEYLDYQKVTIRTEAGRICWKEGAR